MLHETLRMKEALAEKRKTCTNISTNDLAELSGLSIHTVNHFFSNKSKAASAFTVGRLCAVLHVSFDEMFGIRPDEAELGPAALQEELFQLRQHCRSLETELDYKSKLLEAREEHMLRLERVLLGHRRFALAMMCIAIALLSLIVLYLALVDVPYPEYGLLRL